MLLYGLRELYTYISLLWLLIKVETLACNYLHCLICSMLMGMILVQLALSQIMFGHSFLDSINLGLL